MSFNSLMSSLEKCDETGYLRNLLLQEMALQTVTPDVVSYTAAASACELHARWEEAIRLLAECRKPNVFLCSAVISACDKGKQWQCALNIFSNMEHPKQIAEHQSSNEDSPHFESLKYRRLHPNVVTFNAIISACSRASQWERAIALLQELLAPWLFKPFHLDQNALELHQSISPLSYLTFLPFLFDLNLL